MKPLEQKFEQRLDRDWPAITAALRRLIAVPSVEGPAAPRAPFGVNPRQALTTGLEIAQEAGLTTGLAGDAVGWGEYRSPAAATDDYVGIVGHLDVVAAGSGWHTPPFELTITPTQFLGRGVLDNKGPWLSALWALRWLAEDGAPLKRPVRVLAGSNEESGSQDIPKYLAEQPAPIWGYTPDGKYPVVYGERGILRGAITWPIDTAVLGPQFAISGEFSPAIVPDRAALTFPDGHQEHFHGKKAPSNAPELGDNVLDHLTAAGTQLPGGAGDLFQWYQAHFAGAFAGEHANIRFTDPVSGALQLTPYRIALSGDHLTLAFSIRYPLNTTEDEIVSNLRGLLPAGAALTVTSRMAPVKHDPHSPFIQTLAKVYTDITGTDGSPVTTTGATYARSMPNIVAFGPSFPGQKGIAHKEDEWLNISDFRRMLVINYLSIQALANL